MNDSKEFFDPDQITNAEFRDQIKHWIEEQGIHANLQLQMKKDLIEQISRTALGRKITLKLQTHQGIVLSPLVLVLNTLVAEFLYTQNCHYTLSVFSNEVPFKNTLPDFGKSEHFRLSRVELREIFEALGMEHYSGLVEKYEAKGRQQQEGGRSLLYIIFKSMLGSIRVCEEKIKRWKKEEAERDATKTMLDGLEVEKLHRNVEKLLQRVKIVGKGIERIEEMQQLQRNESGELNADEEANSLKVCTESVSRMISRLEVCSKTFEDVIVKLQIQAEAKPSVEEKQMPKEEAPKPSEEKSYTDFLNELKTTDHGKKYVAKLQKQISKLMEKEKALIEAKYARKLHETEMEYKSKLESVLSERIREMSVPREVLQRSPKPSSKPSESEESVHFMKKIDEKLNQLYQHERKVDEKLVTLKSDLQKHELRQSKYFQSLKAAETKEKKLLVLQNVERELLATFEDETQTIIRNAKATIEHLESESDKINQSFQQYLNKQREDKRKLNDEKVQIWQKYNDEKLELNQRELLGFDGTSQQEVTIKQTFEPHREEFPELAAFENPFRNFDPHKYLRRPKIGNVAIDGPRHHQVVDVAVNTSVEPVKEPVTSLTVKEADKQPLIVVSKPSSAESKKSVNANVELLEKARLDHIVDCQQTGDDAKLSELLAKDTLNLKRSIEENLQKLDQMSKTYTKSTSSSEVDKQRTFNVKPTVLEPIGKATEKSLDDLSSGADLELSDGELSADSPEKPGDKVDIEILPNLDDTKELLEFTRRNFPAAKVNQGKGLLDLGSLGSLSDLELSGDSKSNPIPDVERGDSVDDILENISTGKRSLSDNSWN